MQSLSVASKLLPGILFLLLAVFSPPPPCVAVTIEAIYDDDDGEGFNDETELTQAEKDFLAARGNNADTLGEARKNAFEHATSILESALTNTSTIRISVEFVIFSGQEDPRNPGHCLPRPSSVTAAKGGPKRQVYTPDRLDEGDANTVGVGTAYPVALQEARLGVEFNDQEADINILFSKCTPFYYGFTELAPARVIEFVQLSLHETMHGLGFLERVEQDGDFPERVIQITETQNDIITSQREVTIKSRTIYDEQLYSETDDDLLIDLTNSERAAAITSGTRLLWEGLDGGRNDCSYGQRMAELKPGSAKAQDGKPRLYAPSTYDFGGSVSHTHVNTQDLMEPFVPGTRKMDLTLGMLKDIGWSVSADGFPPGCEPTAITVAPTSGLVTTEGGGVAKFEVTLESEPSEDVVIPIISSDTSEGVSDTSELTFTPQNWDTAQEVTVTGVDDDSHDGPQNYFITVDKAESDDRFYDAFSLQTVSLRNDDNEPFPELSIENVSAGEEAGSMDFTVTLSPKSTQTVTVRYAITNDTARQGSDYTASPATATLTFAPGEDQKTISASLVDDNLDEADETFTVTLSNPQNAALAQNRAAATATIRDNDEAALSITDASAPEGSSLSFTVSLSLESSRTVTVGYAITDVTAREGSDYTAAPATATLTFAPGQTRKTISVPTINDNIDEDEEETFTVTLSDPQNAELDQNRDTATGTIMDNDEATLSITDADALEGSSVNFTVSLSLESARTVTVRYAITDATARQGSDYTAAPATATLTFAPGQTQKTVSVPLRDDNINEPEETFTVTLSDPRNAVLAQNRDTATGTIMDNDEAALSIADADALEDAGTMDFTVSLSPQSTQTVTVRYTITGATARQGSDYGATPATATLAFSPGQTQKTVRVYLADDNIDEPDETLTVTLRNPQNAVLAQNRDTATGTIRDNDEAALSISDASALEGAGSMVFTVSLSPQSTQMVSVEYEIADATAEQGSDYTVNPATGTLTFSPGQTQKTISVPLTDDNIDEDEEETFTVTLRNPQNAVLDQNRNTATGTIRDNEQAAMYIDGATTTEGSSLNFTVSLSLQVSQTVTVGYEIADVTAQQGSDYTAAPATPTLTFSPGQTQKTIRVPTINDDIDEPEETFTVILSNLNPPEVQLAQDRATGTIMDNDEAALSIGDASGFEGNSINFTVTLSPQSTQEVSVEYEIADATARQGSDYTAAPATPTLTFAPGEDQATISVPLRDDNISEPEETFTVTLSNPQNAALAQNRDTATGTIMDNDEAALSITDADALEDAVNMDFTVSLNPQSAQTVTVRYTIAGATARQGSDYTATPATGTLTFAPEQTRETVRVYLADDNIDEPDEETLTVTLSNPQNAALAQNRDTATGTIRDNDEAALSITDASGFEGSSINFTVTLSLRSTQTVSVEYEIAGATAEQGSDYTAAPATPTTLTFAPGQTQKTIRVPLRNDDINEPDETFTVILRNPQNAALDRSFAVGTIINRHQGTLITPPPSSPPPPPPPPAVTVSFGSSFYSVTEGETVAVRVTLSEDPERTVTIPITTDQATSAATEDYSLPSTSVTFASGETLGDITLTATDDNVDDDGEVVVLAFGTLPQNVSGGTSTSATVTIRDINSPRLGAEAGENRTVAQREEVILKGSATNAAFGEPTYRWAYTGTRNDIELKNPNTATCSFTAPGGLNEDTVLVFRLVVTDSRGASAEDAVSVTVTGQKVAFSSKDGGGTITLGDGSTVKLTVNRDAGSPPGDPVIILSPDLVEDIDEITFHISADLPEAPPSGFRLEGFVVDIDLGVELGEGETVTVCLPAPQGTQNPALHHYDEESSAWERLESRSETVDGTRSVCAETGAFSLFGVFVAERSRPPVNPPTTGGGTEGGGGGGCAVVAGADRGHGNTAVNLLLIITVLFSVFFRKRRLIT